MSDHPKPKDLFTVLFAFYRFGNAALRGQHAAPITALVRLAALPFVAMMCCPLGLAALHSIPAGLVAIVLLVAGLRLGIYLYRKYQ